MTSLGRFTSHPSASRPSRPPEIARPRGSAPASLAGRATGLFAYGLRGFVEFLTFLGLHTLQLVG